MNSAHRGRTFGAECGGCSARALALQWRPRLGKSVAGLDDFRKILLNHVLNVMESAS
jgi:hypothetical protein